MIILFAKDFQIREDLESYIRAEYGDDIEKNKALKIQIRGTREELRRLKLSDLTTVWGIKCVINDFPTAKEISDKNKPKAVSNGKLGAIAGIRAVESDNKKVKSNKKHGNRKSGKGNIGAGKRKTAKKV